MVFAAAAVERAMKIQQVLMRALSGAITWLQAADILGLEPRSVRRWRARLEAGGPVALYDRRCLRPSRRKAPAPEVQRILRLYRERFSGWNVRHFYRFARREHEVRLSYSFGRLALQEAGLVRKGRARGRHRRRREPRPCFGELLHLDGSRHAWLRGRPDERQTLIAVIDDATKRLLYAQLWPAETTAAVMTALRTVFLAHGLPVALYTDRAGWAFHTPTAGGRVDRTHPTQLGRALARLGIDHIASYSPQGRGRSERLNRTLQGRLINEFHLAGLETVAAANAYLTERFVPDYNQEFAHAPTDPGLAFVPLHGVDLDSILCHEEERTVGQDNVVALEQSPYSSPSSRAGAVVPACESPCAAICTASIPSGMVPDAWAAMTPRAGRWPHRRAAAQNARAHDRRARRRRRRRRPGSHPNAAAAHACPSGPGPDRTDHLSTTADFGGRHARRA